MSVRGCVLLVDHDQNLREFLRGALALEMPKLDVQTARDGAEALDEVRRGVAEMDPFDLLVTDHGIPSMTGAALIRAGRLASPGIRTILMADGDGARRAMESWDDRPRYLAKPFEFREFVSAVHAELTGSDRSGLAGRRLSPTEASTLRRSQQRR